MTVVVGKNRVTRQFHIHLDLLVQESKTIADEIKETGKNSIILRDEKPHIFDLFVEYLYDRKYGFLAEGILTDQMYLFWVEVYLLAYRFGAPGFKNLCLRNLIFSQIREDKDVILETVTYVVESGVSPEDPFCQYVFWMLGQQITKLRKEDAFWDLLTKYPDLSRHICMWFGSEQPELPRLNLWKSERFEEYGKLYRPGYSYDSECEDD